MYIRYRNFFSSKYNLNVFNVEFLGKEVTGSTFAFPVPYSISYIYGIEYGTGNANVLPVTFFSKNSTLNTFKLYFEEKTFR